MRHDVPEADVYKDYVIVLILATAPKMSLAVTGQESTPGICQVFIGHLLCAGRGGDRAKQTPSTFLELRVWWGDEQWK